MNFEHTEDRRMLADTLNRFVAEQYGFQTRNAIAYGDVGMSSALWGRFAELGAIGALFPEAEGGFGGAGFDVAVVFEALGRGLVVEPFLGTLMVGRALIAAGTAAQKESIASLIDGSTLAALAHGEPSDHYELARVSTRAVRRSEGSWTLSGDKAVVLQGDNAQLLLVSARTAGEVDSEDGISLFLVQGDAPGVVRKGMSRIDGGHVAEIKLDNVQLKADSLLGHEGKGFATLELAVGWGVLALCAEALGAMEVAKKDTLEYLQTRKQFGVPIGSFQALQHRMAGLLLEVEQSRSAVINAAAAMDAGRVERERALSAAKFTIGRIGALVSEESIQMHGGIGMTWELPLSHYAKRLVMVDHELGDEDHHLGRYIALGKEAAT